MRVAWTPVKDEPQFLSNDFQGGFPTQPDAACIWKFPPRARVPGCDPPELTNSLGYRGGELDTRAGAARKRVCLLGDSSTFGLGVYLDETFASRLQAWLGVDGFEVVNLGMPGYSAYQMLQMFRSRALTLAPAAIVVYAGAWNDYSPAIVHGDIAAHALIETARRPGLWSAMGRLRFYQFCSSRLSNEKPRGQQEAYRQAWSDGAKRLDGPRLTPAEFRQCLETLAREARAAGAKVVFVDPPVPARTRARYADSDAYAGMVRQVAQAAGSPMAEGRSSLDTSGKLDDLYFADNVHPSFVGHGLLAAAISKAIASVGLTGAPAAPIAFSSDVVSLKTIQAGARHEAGSPLAAASGVDAAKMHPQIILLPSPHRVTFEGVRIPENGSLRFETGFFDAREPVKSEGGAGESRAHVPLASEIVFRIAVKVESGTSEVSKETEVFRLVQPCTRSGVWTPLTRRILDMGAFGGKTGTVILECSGEIPFVSWGQPVFHGR